MTLHQTDSPQLRDYDYDVFISYSSSNRLEAQVLHDAFVEAGLRPWIDDFRMDDHRPVDEQLRQAIESAALTIALSSREQSTSRICRWEALEALRLGHQRGRANLRGIALGPQRVGPGKVTTNDHPWLSWDGQAASAGAVAVKVATAVAAARSEPKPDTHSGAATGRVALPARSGVRFTGRFQHLLDIHELLLGRMALADGGRLNPLRHCVLRGAGGMGKTSMALYFAEQFAPAFPGGVYWVSGQGDRYDGHVETESAKTAVLTSMSRDLEEAIIKQGIGPEQALAPGPRDRWQALLRHLTEECSSRGLALLIVDDLPAGFEVELLMPQGDSMAVLITTRSRSYGMMGLREREIDVFDEHEALALLEAALDLDGSARRNGVDLWNGQSRMVSDLILAVDRHPMALDLLAIRLGLGQSVPDLLREVQEGHEEFLDVAGSIPELPTGHETSLTATIASSLRGVVANSGPSTQAALRILSLAPPGLVDRGLLDETLPMLGHTRPRESAEKLALWSLAQFSQSSIQVHAITRAVMRHLWQMHRSPFQDHIPPDPATSILVSRWYFERGYELRERDDALAAERFKVVCSLLEALNNDMLDDGDKVILAESLVGVARPIYRAGGSRPNLQEAMRVAERAATLTESAPPSALGVRLAWTHAEAMRGLLVGSIAKQGELDPMTRMAAVEESLSICRAALDERRRICAALEELPDPDINRVEVLKEDIARGLYNLPGRMLALAKEIAANSCDAVELERVGGLLSQAVEVHDQVLSMRQAASPWENRSDSKWLPIASGIHGKGMILYYRGLLLASDRPQLFHDLSAAAPLLVEGLRLRCLHKMDDTDASKSAHLLGKLALVAMAALQPPEDSLMPTWTATANDAQRKARQLAGLPCLGGPPLADHPTEAKAVRDEALGGLLAAGPMLGRVIAEGDESRLARVLADSITFVAVSEASGYFKKPPVAALIEESIGESGEARDVLSRIQRPKPG